MAAAVYAQADVHVHDGHSRRHRSCSATHSGMVGGLGAAGGVVIDNQQVEAGYARRTPRPPSSRSLPGGPALCSQAVILWFKDVAAARA